MTAQTLPDEPNYAFCPSYELGDEPQQIRIVFEGMPGYVPTCLIALSLADAERLCDRLNARLGHSREKMDRARRPLHARRGRPGYRRPLPALNRPESLRAGLPTAAFSVAFPAAPAGCHGSAGAAQPPFRPRRP